MKPPSKAVRANHSTGSHFFIYSAQSKPTLKAIAAGPKTSGMPGR